MFTDLSLAINHVISFHLLTKTGFHASNWGSHHSEFKLCTAHVKGRVARGSFACIWKKNRFCWFVFKTNIQHFHVCMPRADGLLKLSWHTIPLNLSIFFIFYMKLQLTGQQLLFRRRLSPILRGFPYIP
jgi:hypothetical protein